RYLRERAREHHAVLGREPVVDVALSGILGFDAGSYERGALEELVQRYFQPLVARVHDNTRDADFDPLGEELGDARDRSTWQQLEVHVFGELLARDARYAPNAAQWARVLAEVKQMALGGEEPAAIARRLRDARGPLMKPMG